MSTLKQPLPAQPFFSMLSSNWTEVWPNICSELKEFFGSFDFISELFYFQESRYYDKELGTPIFRRIFTSEKLLDPAELVNIKHFSDKLENMYLLPSGERKFNLDPGMLFWERLVLATGKNAPHRIYLHSGVWADLTLIYKKGGWEILPWTYPDYAAAYLQDMLSKIRENYRKKIKELQKVGEI